MRAGLRLYQLTAALLDGALRPEDRQVIAHTVARIDAALGEKESRSDFLTEAATRELERRKRKA